MTAYHEAGHAIVIMFTPGANPLHKVTIMPRGQALGITSHLPEMDKYSTSMDEYQAMIDYMMGGKVAEELIYGPDKVTSGVSSVCFLCFPSKCFGANTDCQSRISNKPLVSRMP